MRKESSLINHLKIGALLAATSFCLVGGVSADAPPSEQYRERIPVQQGRQAESRSMETMSTGWHTRLSPGVAVWMFDEEDTEVAPALYMDFWNDEYPLNYRIGIEGRHIDLEQDEAAPSAEFPGANVEATYIRIPLAVEYVVPLTDVNNLYLGGGPDLIRTANDVSDFRVGGHLGARIHHAFNDAWGVAVEGGYAWAKAEDDGSDVDLDGAYVTPTITYTF